MLLIFSGAVIVIVLVGFVAFRIASEECSAVAHTGSDNALKETFAPHNTRADHVRS